MKYFHILTDELQLNRHLFTHYYNIPSQKHRQSSIAIIFKLNKPTSLTESIKQQITSHYDNPDPQLSVGSPSLIKSVLQNTTDNDIQMLFAQRAANELDFNSGNVCFPGGKSDGEESDLSACLREVRQQVGITLLTKDSPYLNLYLGKFRHNFFFRKTRRQNVYISCHLFLILNPNITTILNSSQIYDSRWINFSKITSETPFIFRSKENISGLNSFPWPLKYLESSIRNNLNCIKYSAIEVDLGSPLWGLSLHMYLHLLRIICKKLPTQESKLLQQRIKMGETFTAEFSRFYPLSYPCEWFINRWNKTHRINAFKQPPVKESKLKMPIYLLLVVVLVYLIHYYFSN